MVWFRVDDVLPFHQRVIEAGNAAMGLWVRAGAWSSGQLTDGFIPTTIARQIGTAAEIRRLVDSGLWYQERDGYRFHAWAEDGTGAKRQPTRADVEAQRKAERDRKAAYRAKRDGERNGTGTDGGVPAGVPVGQAAGHLPDGQVDSTQASGHPDPTRPDPTPLPSEGGARSAPPPVDNSEPPLRCPTHLTVPIPPKCGQCKDARLAHDRWAAAQPSNVTPITKPVRHMPGLCDAHRQPTDTCEACAEDRRKGRAS